MEKEGDRFAVIVNTDVDGLSDLLQRQGSRGLGMLKLYNNLIKEAAESKGGRVVRNLGASTVLEFPGAPEAVSFALKVQNAAALSGSDEYPELRIRIGVHYGEVYSFENDILGDGIAVASGLKSFCRPGNLAVSGEIRSRIDPSRIEYPVESRGLRRLEGVAREIDTYEILVNLAGGSMNETEWKRAGGAGPAAESERRADTGEYPVDIDELKHLILENIKIAGKKIDVEKLRRNIPVKSRDLDRMLERLADRGYLNRGTDQSGHVDYGLSERGRDVDWREERDYWKQYAKDLKHYHRERRHARKRSRRYGGGDPELRDDYRSLVAERAERARGAFRGHLIPFVAVNGFLFFLWAITGGGHPWFFYPLGGWGIGLVSHYAVMRRRVEEDQALEAMPDLSVEEMGLLQRLFRAKSAWSAHLTSNAAVAGYLFMINLITSPGFLWSLIPAFGMGVGLASHWSVYKANTRKLVKQIRGIGGDAARYVSGALRGRKGPGIPAAPKEEEIRNPENRALVAEALRLKRVILTQIGSLGKESSPFGDDTEATLENYVQQIRALGKKDDELERLIGSIPAGELDGDLAKLRQKVQSAESDTLRREYDRSITEIERQKKSFGDLCEQKEVLHLRLRSAVNNMKQMQIDLARMQNLSVTNDSASIMMLKDQTKELSQYLDDFRSGIDELEK